jgi:hypothetical protein
MFKKKAGQSNYFSTYKTSTCSDYMYTGKCKKGDNCEYAHGVEELRPDNWEDPCMEKDTKKGKGWHNPHKGNKYIEKSL